ncbi:hypothetical protein NLI96_g13209 [Meripilus lineatus]|uniref:DUF427 domain-containing protein n=1 Tax=Meripilus lineatus TaxID=2056292 RepID=A0AAD5UQA5_9APHY|nr:hypothetical protein NLI96_g13209 [Physisporinus lineatus]
MSPPFSDPHIERSLKRVRVLFGGKYIVDTTNAKLVWFKPWYPTYSFSLDDIDQKYLVKSIQSPSEQRYDIVVGDRKAEAAVTHHIEGDYKGLATIEFGAVDAWFEEDEQIFVHPKDPYKRVDVLQSSRHVRVELNGIELANTKKPRLLFETGLHVRTYISKTDCRLDLLEPSTTTTQCPYKGVANYYHVNLPSGEQVKDIVWWYRTPQPECGDIKGLVAFYDEKVDVFVDGVRQT